MSCSTVVCKVFAARAAACLVLCLAASVAWSQTADTGAIAGTVTDSPGAVVPQAEIKAVNLGTGETRTAASAQSGSYSIPLLPPGTYRVDVSKDGFKLLSFSRVAVIVAETATLNARLEVGAVSEHITVSSEAEQLQTATSALGRVTNEEMIVDLPLVTRNYTQIIGLNAGVSAEVTNATALGRGAGGESNFSSAGGTVKSNLTIRWMESPLTTFRTAAISAAESRYPILIRFRSSRCKPASMTPLTDGTPAPM